MVLKHSPKIGDPALRIDGRAKVTGQQIYPSDYFLDGMLSLRVLRSPHAHAKILSIDTRAAEQATGVVCVLTAEDIPGDKMTGLSSPDMPVLCDELVRRQGDPIAIVAAESDSIARRACDLIEVAYELLPLISDPRQAMSPANHKLHPDGNIISELHIENGAVDEIFAFAELVFEHEYTTSRQEHAHIETESGAAYYDEDGRLTVRFGGQHPHWDQEIISKILGLERDEVRIISPMMGGSFGGKDDIDVQSYLALVTYLTKRPCRMAFDRRESLIAGTKRHPFICSYKTACTKDGQWLAAQVELIADSGAYTSWGPAVLNVAVDACLGHYQIPNVKVDAYCVYTNNANASAFRGFGAPQVVFGLEQQVDIMARACGMDAIDFRRKNAVQPGMKAALGFNYDGDDSFMQILDAASQGPIYDQPEHSVALSEPECQDKKRGIGVAAAWMGIGYGAGVPDNAEVHVKLTDQGRYQLLVGGTDMGQGNGTAFVQMVAHELNCQMDDIDLILGDSLGPDSGSCDAARQITLVGRATVAAGRDLCRQIQAESARELGTAPEEILLEGRSAVIGDTGERRSLAGLGELTGKGFANLPELEPLIPGIPKNVYVAGAQVALVEVDLMTGKVDVLKMHNVIDAGKVINRQGVEGQSEGGLVQGVGYALFEDCILSEGKLVNSDFSSYIIPSVQDIPDELKTTILEEPSTIGPYGAKGIAEVVIVPTAPAILNAVYDAIGERFTKIPLTQEEVKMRLIGFQENGG
jgi:xanthine dehydrogenase molybdenum-binding subunit